MDPDLERLINEIDGTSRRPRPATPQGPLDRLRLAVRSRFAVLALGLALAEVIVLVWKHSSALLGAMLAGLALVLAVMAWVRLRPGLFRDLLGIFALAQAMVVAVPLAIAFSVGVGLFIAVALLIGVGALIFSRRR